MAAPHTDHPTDQAVDLGRRRFLRRAATAVGVGLGLTMAASPARAAVCMTKCTRVAPCWACSGLTFFKCSCSGSTYYTCQYKCTDSYCKSFTHCV
jgi:hypothetical protein